MSTQISIIVPICNEEGTVKDLTAGICAVLEGRSFEILFVDDGSRDQSWTHVSEIAKQDERVHGIRLRRNFGKADALAIGFQQAAGEIIVTMDGDLQDDPKEIPNFLAKLDEGYDMVSGWKHRRNDPLDKTLPSKIFNFFTRALSGLKLNDFNCGFKAYRREAVEHLTLYGELHRYIPILVDAEGYRIAEIPVEHHPRTHGTSKYGWKRLLKGGLDLLTVIVITRYLRRPGHFFGGFGLLSGSLGFLVLAWLSVQKLFFAIPIGGRPLFFLGILLTLLGVQLISIGLLGELIQLNASRHSSRHSDSTIITERC